MGLALKKSAKMTIALKEIHERWVISTNTQSSMQAIEYNKENHSILNKIYDILAEFQNQGKQVTLCTHRN